MSPSCSLVLNWGVVEGNLRLQCPSLSHHPSKLPALEGIFLASLTQRLQIPSPESVLEYPGEG